MRFTFLFCFVMLSIAINGQQIGVVQNGDYSIELHKTNTIYSCIYSDINDKSTQELKSFKFSSIDKIYAIIIEGFEHDTNHKTFVLTDKDTVIKFEFSKVNGLALLKIKHNNLINNIIGSTFFLNKKQISKLFGIDNQVVF